VKYDKFNRKEEAIFIGTIEGYSFFLRCIVLPYLGFQSKKYRVDFKAPFGTFFGIIHHEQ